MCNVYLYICVSWDWFYVSNKWNKLRDGMIICFCFIRLVLNYVSVYNNLGIFLEND